MKTSKEIFEICFQEMPNQFSSHDFLKACRNRGLSDAKIETREHLVFLKERCTQDGKRFFIKNNSINELTFPFAIAKKIVEEHGYIVCKKEITLTPI